MPNYVYGTSYDDTLHGTSGEDEIHGGYGNDVVFAWEGNDSIDGGDGNDTVFGGEGSDIIRGGWGYDVVYGGGGNDTFIVSDNADLVVEFAGQGIDWVYSMLSSYTLANNVESAKLIGEGGGALTGNDLNNMLIGGGYSKDTLSGGGGSDTVYGEGNHDQLSGGAGDDWLMGGEGHDTLNGGEGADTMNGGLGDDRYEISDASDVVIEGALGGRDEIRSFNLATINLAKPAFANVENAYANAQAGLNITMIGSGLDNILFGNDLGNDTLSGGAGKDHLLGLDGKDVLNGGVGDDSVYGWTGADTLNGGAGKDLLGGGEDADTFVFSAISHSVVGAGRDVIDGFVHGSDHINLASIDARTDMAGNQAFTWLGAGAFTGKAGQLRAFSDGWDKIVEGDVNGDGKADFQIALDYDYPSTLTAGDFIL